MSKYAFKSFNHYHYELKKSQIDLWLLSLNEDLPQLANVLSSEENERANRFYFKRHQRRFQNTRAFLRIILSRYLDCKAQDICFQYNKHGKPFIKSTQQIQFNVSHTGEWALIGIGKTFALGVDVEHYSSRPYQGIAEQLFSNQEQKLLKSFSPAQKPWLFFNIWSQKEAFIKACGLGLFYPTETFTVSSALHQPHNVLDTNQHTLWTLQSFMPKIALHAALCHHTQVEHIRYLELTDTQMLLTDVN